MEEVRVNELATNIDTLAGTEFHHPWAQAGGSPRPACEEEEEFQCHQPVWESDGDGSSPELDEVDDVEFVYTEAEKDAARRLVASHGFKRPRSPALPPSVPDLAEVFDQHDTTPATRVSVCRAYASYVASTLPKKPKAPKKKASKARSLHFE